MSEWVIVSIIISHLPPIFALQPPSGEYVPSFVWRYTFDYRQLHPDILLEMDDLDELTLKEYDDLCGVNRKYISTRKMAHLRQRVKDRQRMKIATSHQEMN